VGKVLIVDDEASIRETLSEFVKEDGHEVISTDDAGTALELVRNAAPDVVVTDIILPRVTGVCLLREIHEIAPDVQVIMITGEPTAETAAEAVRLGAFDYLAKPILRDGIRSAVASALRVTELAKRKRELEEENARHREDLEKEVAATSRALAQSEEKYRMVVEHANEAVFVAQDGFLRFVNPKTVELTGYSARDLMGMPFPQLIHPEDRELVVDRFRRRLHGEDVLDAYEFRIVDAHSETRWIEIRPVVIEWEGAPATLNLASDITQRRRAAEALATSEKKWRELFENLRDGWVSTDMEGRFLECNRAYEEMLGYSLEELAQRTYEDLTPEKWRAYERDVVTQRIVERGYSGVYRKEYIRKDGTVLPVELSAYLIRDSEGRPAGMWGLARDMSERMAAEVAKEESEARYRALFENSPISLWQEDYSETKRLLDEVKASGVDDIEEHLRDNPDLVEECIRAIRVVDVNQATVTMHRAASKKDLVGHLLQIIPPESRTGFTPQLVAIANGDTSCESEGIDERLDGTKMHVAVRWTVAPGFERTMERVLVSKIDVTATVEADRAIRAALRGTIEAIGLTTETRDPYTAGHQRRVTELAVAIAEELALDEKRIEGMRAAALMHDIGKMAVPAEILSKPSRLTEMEMALIQSHPQVAYDILKSISFPWPLAEIVRQHHEWIDGSGYPQGLRGDEILPEARILAVADTVEAMASHRPYRAALGIDVALEEIETHRGTRYEPDVVDACLRLFRDGRFAFGDPDSRPN